MIPAFLQQVEKFGAIAEPGIGAALIEEAFDLIHRAYRYRRVHPNRRIRRRAHPDKAPTSGDAPTSGWVITLGAL